MNDFYFEAEKSLKEGTVNDLISRLHADPNINLSINPKPIMISNYAFYKSHSGYDSLEQIFDRSAQLNREIPFAGIIDEKQLLITEFIRGVTGDQNGCDWQAGPLLQKAYKKASELDKKVILGHTHPKLKYEDGKPKPYGAICSRIYYTEEDLKQDNEESRLILKSGLHDKYGGDYLIMFMMAQTINLISPFFSIMSPRENQVGFFEIKEKGKVVYHPWKINK
jgi:hypothetical protein